MSKFRKIEIGIQDLFLIELTCFQDQRGYFSEIFQKEEFEALGITKAFVQKNISSSKRGVLRGLHYQEKKPQGKLLRVIKGSIYDVVVDLRQGSPSYEKWFGVTLTEKDSRLLWIPEGFAHGFLSLEEDSQIQYSCTDYYAPDLERGILWSDQSLAIDWKLEEFGFSEKDLILSEKDKNHPSFFELTQKEKGKILILGAKGQLGKEFQTFFQKNKIDCIASDIEDLDITKEKDSQDFMQRNHIDIVVNCAAYNDVDKAEQEEMRCQEVNIKAVQIWTDLCRTRKIPFLTFSTDFIFDGEKETPYTEADYTNPLSTYGVSKEKGEKIALDYKRSLVIRTSWLFGSGGHNFCKQLLDWAGKKEELYIVEDQISSPTYTKHLVKFSWELLQKACYGLYHMSNSGEASKYEQAKYLLSCIDWQGKLHRAKTEDFPLGAKRPKYSKLDTTKLEFCLLKKMPHWKLAIQEYLKEVGKV